MLKKVSQTNQDVALSVVQPEKLKTVAAIHVHNVKCSPQFALLAAKRPQFLSNLQVTSPFIAVTATNPVPEATGKIDSKTLPGIKPGRVFYCLLLITFKYIYYTSKGKKTNDKYGTPDPSIWKKSPL
jgi:hypothetical protein